VDLQERLALDVAREQLGKVRARARPWRSIIAIIAAVLIAALSSAARHATQTTQVTARGVTASNTDPISALGRPADLAIAYGGAAVFFLLGSVATIGLGNAARDILRPSVGSSHAAVVRFAVVIIAGVTTIVTTMVLFGIPVTQLLVGGALTGVLVGIAAQQSLANVFAGIVLLFARPFRVGDRIGVRSGALGGLIEGVVSEVTVNFVRLETPNGPVYLPNSQVLNAVVGPAGAVPSTMPAPPPVPGPAPSAAGPAEAVAGQAVVGQVAAGQAEQHQAAPGAASGEMPRNPG
jgi:small-conductance mechanosensitive channel